MHIIFSICLGGLYGLLIQESNVSAAKKIVATICAVACVIAYPHTI